MKTKIFAVTVLLFTLGTALHAQSGKGAITIGGRNEWKVEMTSNSVVDLYAQFRGKDMPILFNFDATGILKSTTGKAYAPVRFTTTVRYNGKVIGSKKTDATPFFPGDMWMPVENFEFVPILFNTLGKGQSDELPKGQYEINLQAESQGIRINPGKIVFEVR
jgi:hypothetical protein